MAESGSTLQGLTSREGIFRGEDGHLYIPGTKRPNGTYRKPIRVKEGYIPQDEQPAYENKGVKWIKDRPDCPGLVVETPAETAQSKNAEKNRKKKEAKKRAAEKKTNTDTQAAVPAAGGSDNRKISERLSAVTLKEEGPIDPAEITKRLKNLRKRLAQIDALKAKIDSGELPKPDPDQLRKVQRRSEVVDEIDELEMKS